MRQEADEVVCLEDNAAFGAIGFYYSDFRQVSDEEVIEAPRRYPV
jgi:putative phosphoribosyl transferase